MRHNQRRRFLVHRQIQMTLVRRLCLYWGVFVIATCFISMLIQYLLDPLQDAEEASFRFRLTVGSTLLVAGCLAPIFIRDMILFSHRFVGPLVRLRQGLQMLGREQPAPIQLRTDDYWQELIADYNQLLTRLPEPVSPPADATERQPTS